MKTAFHCDDSMVITIPIGSLKDIQEGRLMPDKFHCVFKDVYKVFVVKGKPKPLGAAQAIAGVFLLCLGIVGQRSLVSWIYTLPSVLFVVSGLLTCAAGHFPNMRVTKLSFSLNIISFFWSVVAVSFCTLHLQYDSSSVKVFDGIKVMSATFLLVEMMISSVLIYWLSKAICRQHFNTLPIIMLKQENQKLKA